MSVNQIKYGSDEWAQARKLRYELLYKENGCPETVLDDAQEEHSDHLGLIVEDKIAAYGRLTEVNKGEFHIFQIVVDPKYQGCGYGKDLMNGLVTLAKAKKAETVELDARLSAINFYKKCGFATLGNEFNSKITGIPHIKMQWKNQ